MTSSISRLPPSLSGISNASPAAASGNHDPLEGVILATQGLLSLPGQLQGADAKAAQKAVDTIVIAGQDIMYGRNDGGSAAEVGAAIDQLSAYVSQLPEGGEKIAFQQALAGAGDIVAAKASETGSQPSLEKSEFVAGGKSSPIGVMDQSQATSAGSLGGSGDSGTVSWE